MNTAIKDRVVSGLVDGDIKTSVLSHREVNKWTLDDLVGYVETKEAGKTAVSLMGGSGSTAGVFNKKPETGKKPFKDVKDDKKPRCDNCGRAHGRSGPCPAEKLKRFNCEMQGHLASKCKKPKKPRENARQVDAEPEKQETVE